MLTTKRMFEIVNACDGLTKSPNITEFGKEEAKKIREDMIKQLAFFGS